MAGKENLLDKELETSQGKLAILDPGIGCGNTQMRMPAGPLHDPPECEKQMRLLSVLCIEFGHEPHLCSNNSESLDLHQKNTTGRQTICPPCRKSELNQGASQTICT